MKEKATEKRKRRKGESVGLMENTDHENGRRQCDRRNGRERKKENWGGRRKDMVATGNITVFF